MVGVSLLAFILGDLLTSNRSFFGSETHVAVIGGKKINVQDFEARIQKLEAVHRLNNESQTLDQATVQQLRDQAWGQLLNDEVMVRQMEKAGIVVSEEELYDMVQGKHIHSQIKEAFTDPKTGQFSAANVVQFLKNMDQDQTGRTRAQWVAFESGIRLERANQKFNDMVRKGVYATTAEARRMHVHTNRMAKLKYLQLPYTAIADSAVVPTESELQTYYNAHKKKYEQDASRHIQYVVFDVSPTQEDRLSAAEYVNKLAGPFNTSSDDSAFVSVNADSEPDFGYNKKGMISPRLDSVLFDAPVGTVIGPFEENGFFKLAKLTDKKMIADSIKVSHALVAFAGAERAPQGITRTAEEAGKMADSLLALCEKDAEKYIEIARYNSDDVVAGQKDGDLGWINADSPMDPRFLSGAFAIQAGEVGVVESSFGFHLIKVFESAEASEQVQIMVIDRMIEPGTKTYQTVFSKANEFAGRYNTAVLFDSACVNQGLHKRELDKLTEAERNVPGLEAARELVRWAFVGKEGEVSKAFEFGDKFVVAKLVGVKEKGIAPMEQVLEQVRGSVIIDLKARQLIKRLNDKGLENKTIEAVAQSVGQEVKTAENVSFATPYLASLGMEPHIVGWTFTLNKGEMSKPFQGEAGVYVIEVESFTEAVEKTDFYEDRMARMRIFESRAEYEVFNSLRDKADIVDNRGKFY